VFYRNYNFSLFIPLVNIATSRIYNLIGSKIRYKFIRESPTNIVEDSSEPESMRNSTLEQVGK